MDALGMLVMVFALMSVVSVIGILLMFLVKNEKVKNGLMYFLGIWGMAIAYFNVQGIPEQWIGESLTAWVLGGLSVAAILIQLCSKSSKRFMIARILVTVSVIAGVIDCFMF